MQSVLGLGTGWASRINRGHDAPLVRLIDADKTATREKVAGQSPEESHKV